MPGTTTASAASLAELVDQLGRSTYGGRPAEGLNPAQWTALRFFSRANRFSRTVSAFAAFHGTTRGTASQTVKALVDKGYLQRMRVEGDGRSFRLDLTGKAKRSLVADPLGQLASATRALSTEQRDSVSRALQIVLDRLLTRSGQALFGACTSCRHLCRRDGRRSTGAEYECACRGESLQGGELDEVCVDFEPRS